MVVRGVGVLLGRLPLVVAVVGASARGGVQGALAGKGRQGCGVQDQSGRYAARSAWSELTGRARRAADDTERTHLHARFCRTVPSPTTTC